MSDSLITNIEFSLPWVWLLLPLPLLVYFLFPAYKGHSESVRVPNLRQLVSDKHSFELAGKTNRKWPYFPASLIWLCLLAVAAQPQQIIEGKQEEVSVRDILLVLDASGSMAIRDMKDENGNQISRMTVLQQAVAEFIGKRQYDNIGLIVFGSQALPLTPVSQDHAALLEQIAEMEAGMAGPQTSIGDAIGVGIKTYRQLKEANEKKQDSERMMILLTDGLDTSSVLPPTVALRLAQKQNLVIHTIAFGNTGSDEGGASIDIRLLEKIAKETKGSFHKASDSLSSLKEVYSAIDKQAARKMKLVGATDYKPLFIYPLLTSFVLTALLLIIFVFAGRKKSE